VIVFNYETNETANILIYAPVLLYTKGRKITTTIFADGSRGVSSRPEEFAHYIPKEFLSNETKESYKVYPNKAGYYVFSYGEVYKANDGMFCGHKKYEDICDLILRNKPVNEGEAKMRVGDGGKFYLTNIEAFYP